MAERHRSKSRGLPLTVRLLAALLVGSLFLGVVVTKLASRQELAALGRDQEARMQKLAASLAARTAPLLQGRDDPRLAILCASVAELGARRLIDRVPEAEDEDLGACCETELEVADPVAGDPFAGDSVEEDRG